MIPHLDGDPVVDLHNIADGSSYGRTTPNQVTGAGRAYSTLDSHNQVASTYQLKPLNNASIVTTGSGLSQSGTSKTINIASGSQQWGAGVVNYSSGSVTVASYSVQYYIYADDPQYAGGAVTYAATSNVNDLYANDGRIYFGKITLVSGGGGGGGGVGTCFTAAVDVRTPSGYTPFGEMADHITLVNETGTHEAELLTHEYAGWMLELAPGKLVTLDHLMKVGPDQWDRAENKYVGYKQVWFGGTVYNLHVVTEDDRVHSGLVVL